uniref:DUF4537 domain-containing protein n=1 Tax=Seriola lalandi dorsalis TaxID=1841481 RepID=A0A3B4X5G5_SERLL
MIPQQHNPSSPLLRLVSIVCQQIIRSQLSYIHSLLWIQSSAWRHTVLNMCNTSAVHWPIRCSLDHPPRPVSSCVLSGRTLGGSEFFPGCRVLARREVDGFYYLGNILFPCIRTQDRTAVWVVEFDHPGGSSLGVVSSQRQLVCSLDMVSHIKDHTHCLVPGDTVLSPWEPGLRRYGPGRVMAATEHRGGIRGRE